MGAVKKAFTPFAVGFIASVGVAAIDSGLAKYPAARRVVKGVTAVVIALAGRKYPVASVSAIAALGASEGYAIGTQLVGGMIAHSPEQAVKGLGDMTQTYPEIGALLQGGVGALLQGMGGPPDVAMSAVNYETALQGLGDDTDE